MQHYRVLRPLDTHWEAANCAEVDCLHYLSGWVTIVPEGSPQARYIRLHSGRGFTEEKREGGLVAFTFPPGQRCFREHKLPRQDVAPIFTKEVQGQRQRMTWEPWMDDFNEHSYRINQARKRG